MIETEDGKVFELDSPKGSAWLESIGSFRFEPSGDSKPYTVRKESGIYWYGCRKIAGKVRKKYIGKSSEVTAAKLEEIAEALEIPPVPRANKVAEVAQRVAQAVAQGVAQGVAEVAQVAQGVAEVAEVAQAVAQAVAQDRLAALELQVANLQKTVEALQEALLGKLELGDPLELPKVDNEVAERLQNELGNLKAENEKLRADYAALLESSTHVTNKLRQEVQELRSQLETERADREEIERELSEKKQNSAPAATLSEKLTPDAATILSQLRAKRKKSPVSLTDIQAILEIMEES
jgi:chromosome segregation ATPase